MENKGIEKDNIIKNFVLQTIMDELYDVLILSADEENIKFSSYRLSDETMTLLLKKYDEERFNAYKILLKKKAEERLKKKEEAENE